MGLPRHLNNDMSNYFNGCSRASLFMAATTIGQLASAHGIMLKVKKAEERLGLSALAQVNALATWAWKRTYRRQTGPDELARVKADLYIGLERDRHSDRPAFRQVEIPRYFKARLERENERREVRDRQALALRERIQQVRGRVYASRTFPVTLRAIIFERDNHTCRLCLRDRAKLQEAGLHLECDHILAWDDGGLTTYDNGQTVCNECNTAKHHAKNYLGLVARMKAS